MSAIYKNMLSVRLRFFFISILSFCYLSIFNSYAADLELTGEDYFEIARVVSGKNRGKELVLRNVLRDHTSQEFGKSYFSTNDPQQIERIIDSVVESPSYYDFSKSSNKLMIIKDFTTNEALDLIGQNFIGVHITPSKRSINSNRVTLFFGIDKLLDKGKPWDPTKGVLLTGFPDNPTRSYS